MSHGRNLEIDRLRSIGAIIVITCHLIYIFFPGVIHSEHGFATTIIDLYFAISGYVIAAALMKPIDHFKQNKRATLDLLKAFYIKRIFRIYPPLWAAFFLIVLLGLIFRNANFFSDTMTLLKSSIMLLTSTFNFYFVSQHFSLALAPLWSLAIEEQFYLLFPLFLIFTDGDKQRVRFLLFAMAMIVFVLRPLTLHFYGYVGMFFTQCRFDSIICGVLLYILSQQSWFESLKPQHAGSLTFRLGLLGLLFYIIIGVTSLDCPLSVCLTVNCFFVSVLLLLAIFEKGIVSFPYPMQKFLDVMAPRTYGLYIIHFPIILVVNELFRSTPELSFAWMTARIAVSIIMTAIFSEMIYRFVLVPCMSRGKMLAEQITVMPASTELDDCSEIKYSNP